MHKYVYCIFKRQQEYICDAISIKTRNITRINTVSAFLFFQGDNTWTKVAET